MSDRLPRKLSRWKQIIFEVGLFVWFLLAFGAFLGEKVWEIVRPLFR